MSGQNHHIYEFGPFRLDASKRLLLRAGEPVKLFPKEFDTLLALVEHSGEVLDKDELMRKVWPDAIVEEGNLTTYISHLRKALGEKPNQHQYIVTVPGQGYLFVAGVRAAFDEVIVHERARAEVTFEEEAGEREEVERAVPVLAPRRARKFLWPTLTACALLAGLTTAYYIYRAKQTGRPIAAQQQLVSTFPGSHRAASFSPDGQKIAFINAADGAPPQVWVKDLTEGEPVQITFGEERAGCPRWSPLGDQIVYVRQSQGADSIWSVSPAGGTPRKVIEGGRNPNWSWDGARLVFERGYDIWTANADGGDQHRVEGVPPTDLLLADRSPAFSPDGSFIAFFQQSKGPHGDFWAVPAAGGQARRLTFDDAHGGKPVWTPDGRFIVFPSRRAGSMTLWKVPVAGGEPQPVLLSAGEDTDPEISRDGRRLIYANSRDSYIVTLTDPATGQQKELHESRTGRVDPSFSPRGDQVLFFGFASGGGIHLFTVNVDGSNFTQLTRGRGEQNVFPQWSADGSAIYFYQHRPDTSFRKLSLRDGRVTDLVQGWEWATHTTARVDPEGRRIIYTRLDKGEPAATMIRDVATGSETAFALLLRDHRWSRDGRFIVGTHVQGQQWSRAEITVCPAEGGGPCRALTRGYWPRWSGDGSLIYFYKLSDLADGEELWTISPDGSGERKITGLRPMHPIIEFFDVSPTGQIVWVQYRQSKRELWLSDFPHP